MEEAQSEPDINRAMSISRAAMATAGLQSSDFADDMTQRHLRGEVTTDRAVKLIIEHAKLGC